MYGSGGCEEGGESVERVSGWNFLRDNGEDLDGTELADGECRAHPYEEVAYEVYRLEDF